MKIIRMIMIVVPAVLLSATALRAQVRINIMRGGDISKTEAIDDAVLSVGYRMSFVEDTSKRDKPNEETMMLIIGRKSSVFYSYARHLQDSVMAAGLSAGASMESIAEKMRSYASAVSYKVYKNYPSGKVTTLEQVAGDRFRCEEVNAVPEWVLTEDTATILSYPCRKATCSFRGRNYSVWYTADIPRSEGPWKLHGLPGLILRAEDDRGEYAFDCTGIVHSSEGQTIQYGASGYEPVTRRNLNRQYERYAADPVGYVTSSNPNAKIVIRNESGQEIHPKDTPYNPIELREE
jgi:GLPGLI family protein